MTVLTITINEKEYSIENRALRDAGPLIEYLFTEADEQTVDLSEIKYSKYLSDILLFVNSGEISKKLLKISRSKLKSVFIYYGLPFYVEVLDYPNEILKHYFYWQWYRLKRSDSRYDEFFKSNCRLIIFDLQKEENSEDNKFIQSLNYINSTITYRIYNEKNKFTSHLISKKFKYDYFEFLENKFDEFYNNILIPCDNPGYETSRKKIEFENFSEINQLIFESFNQSNEGTTKELDVFMKGIFDLGVVVAGGFMFDILTNTNKKDIDLFLVKPENYEKVIEFIGKHQKLFARFVRTESTITFEYLQIILRKFNSIEDLLNSFDLPHCSIAFDGKKIYMTELAKICLSTRTTYLFFDSLCMNTELRLVKHSRRKLLSVYIPECRKYSKDKMLLNYSNGGLSRLVSQIMKFDDREFQNKFKISLVDYEFESLSQELKEDNLGYKKYCDVINSKSCNIIVNFKEFSFVTNGPKYNSINGSEYNIKWHNSPYLIDKNKYKRNTILQNLNKGIYPIYVKDVKSEWYNYETFPTDNSHRQMIDCKFMRSLKDDSTKLGKIFNLLDQYKSFNQLNHLFPISKDEFISFIEKVKKNLKKFLLLVQESEDLEEFEAIFLNTLIYNCSYELLQTIDATYEISKTENKTTVINSEYLDKNDFKFYDIDLNHLRKEIYKFNKININRDIHKFIL